MKQWILYNVFLPSFLPGCESGMSVSRSKDSEFSSRSSVVVQTGWEKGDVQAEPACLSKHRGLQLAETLGDAGPFLLCAETTNRFVCQRQCHFSLS